MSRRWRGPHACGMICNPAVTGDLANQRPDATMRRMPLDLLEQRLRNSIKLGQSLARFRADDPAICAAVVALPDEEEYARVMAEGRRGNVAPACSGASRSCAPRSMTACPTHSSYS